MQESLMQRDLAVNWHPYSQMKTTVHLPIVRAKGSYLFDANGKSYLDMISSWWVTIHGHAHPYIAKKMFEQLNTLEHVIYAGFTHPSAIELSERLLALLPDNQQKMFYSDNGSTAVEVALKMCIQKSYNQGVKKNKIIAFKNAYHGDTFGAMSVSQPGPWTIPFADFLFEVIFIDVPAADNLSDTKKLIASHRNEIACLIYEPLVQGAAGMLMHHAEDLSELMRYCRESGIYLIQDEVFVGFGRTGTLFAADQLSQQPDIMCFSKGLTGGTLAMGLTSCSQEIYDAFYADQKYKALFHGHSFTANPVSCAAALASLDLLLQQETQSQIQRIVKQQRAFANKLKNHPKLVNVRCLGTILAMDFKQEEETSYFSDLQESLYAKFIDKGILIRPLGNIIYLLPPYSTSQKDLDYVYTVVLDILNE